LQGVLLATCYDEAEWARLAAMAGGHVRAEVTPAGDVAATPVDEPSAAAGGAAQRRKRVQLAPPGPWAGWAVAEPAFAPGVVGAKALNLAKLRKLLPDQYGVPSSVALPFGTFEAVLSHEVNAAAAEHLITLLERLDGMTVRTKQHKLCMQQPTVHACLLAFL
jgi:alpha-glucan, water dikinase